MKINGEKIEGLYSYAKADKAAAEKNVNIEMGAAKDKVTISIEARAYSAKGRLTRIVVDEVTRQTPSEKLLKLKNEIASGTYNVSSDEIAAAILGEKQKN